MVLMGLLLAGCDSGGTAVEPDEPRRIPSVNSYAVTVENDSVFLPGRLLVPDTSATVPGVVLVHGSGAIDRNGQDPAGVIPPIFELWAEYMAKRGIAVLRYDKRTTREVVREGNPRFNTFLDYVGDAVAAGREIREREGVDPDRIVYVGHSQGGNVAPAAASRLGTVAGVVSLAGPALAMDSLLVAQLDKNGGRADCLPNQVRAQFDSLRTEGLTPTNFICGAGPTFWRQWIRHSQKMDSVAAALDAPFFVQQGRSDSRYPGEMLKRSLDGWRRIAQTHDVTIKTYEGVDHFFREEGTGRTAEPPLKDLIDWIRERGPDGEPDAERPPR